MVYQYDQALQLPTVDLYDTQMMAMALQVAKDMYDRGEQQIKDFQKNFGDFLTPITADQNWWNQNVTGRVRDAINQMYARGGDPLRNAQDRAQISMLINNMPYGDMALIRNSAKNAEQYQKERAKLEAQGLYNPAIEKYAGKGLDTFSTVDDGVWNRLSPVPYQNMSDFSKSYFDNIKPFKTSASKNGISYTKSEISMGDLRRIAKQHHNDLVNTPQGQLMYKYYKDLYGSDEAARNAFDEAVVSGNTDRLYYEDDYNDNYLKRWDLRLKQEDNNLARDRFNWEKEKYNKEQEDKNNPNGDNSEGRNYYQDQFDRGLNYFTYGREGMPSQSLTQDAQNGRNVLKVAQVSMKPLNDVSNDDSKWENARNAYLASKVSRNTLSQKVLVESSGREVDKSRSHTVFTTVGDIDRMYSDDNIVANTFGGIRNNNTRKRRVQDNSDLDDYKNPKEKLDQLKMKFTDETYTAPIVGKDGKVRMTQFQKVYLYDNLEDKYITTKWYKVQESDPAATPVEKHVRSKDGRVTVVRQYRSVPTTQSSSQAGEMQYNASEAEHVLHSTSEGKHNTQTRY